MCGICGIVNTVKERIDEDRVRAMAEAMSHRGPDDEGVYSGKGACLGHRRLSIIDLSTVGHQPLSNEDGSVWVAANGEIYNYQELRKDLEKRGHRFKSHTDTEVIVHLYEDSLEECVNYLRGMFAFALWDVKKKQLFLARDRLGKKPLLYAFSDGNFCFASEFDSLLKCGLVSKEINPQALDGYLTFGYIPVPLTIYKGVFKLPAAHTLIFKDNRISIKRYWRLDFQNKVEVSEAEAEEKALDLLREAVRIRLHSDVPLGVFLSGGIDSSMVVGLMSQVYGQRIRTFSIGFEESDYNELGYARNIARYFQTEHQELIVKPQPLEEILPMLARHYGEPYADPSCVPTYYLSRMCKEYITVALNGDGGDETFAGYERYQAMMYSQVLGRLPAVLTGAASYLSDRIIPDSIDARKMPRKIKRFVKALPLSPYKRYIQWVGIFDEERKKNLYRSEFLGPAKNFPTEKLIREILSGDTGLSLLDRLSMLDISTYLPDDLLVKVDIASMANGLEVRSPLLDHKLMEFTASLPPELKVRGFTRKYLFKKIASKIIPKENIHRVKQGFGIPVARWLRRELKGMLCDYLLTEDFAAKEYLSQAVVREMVKQHLEEKKDYGFQLWTLLMFELWHKNFMEKQ